MKKTIEQQTAETVLQKPIQKTICGVTYQIAPLSTATLIEVSQLVSQLPHRKLDLENILYESLSVAKDCRLLGEIAAIMVIGAQIPTEREKKPQNALFRIFTRTKKQLSAKELGDVILHTLSPSQLHKLIIEMLGMLEISDFFGLTTSLLEVNLLQQTVEVEK